MSIVNFEEITEDLSELEMKYVDKIKNCIRDIFTVTQTTIVGGRAVGDSWLMNIPIKQPELCERINGMLIAEFGLFTPIKITPVRLRKYFSYFRSNGILPIVATSDGCYISEDKTEIEKQIISLQQRARQILKAAEGMKSFLTK